MLFENILPALWRYSSRSLEKEIFIILSLAVSSRNLSYFRIVHCTKGMKPERSFKNGHWIISFKEIYILCSFSISYLDFRKFKPRWVADKLHWGRPDLGELVQKRWMKISEDVKNPQQYFQLSVVSWIYVKEPILMEDVKVTENRITQRSQRNVPNYEKRKNNPFGN